MSSSIWEPVDEEAKRMRFGTIVLVAKVRNGEVYDVEMEPKRRWSKQDISSHEGDE